MNFILIPFLLATDIINNDDAWYNGPEYKFVVSASTTSNTWNSSDQSIGSILVSELKCRPREPNNLNCHFENPRIGRLTPKEFNISEDLLSMNTNYEPYIFSEANFEIGFDRNGINYYIFDGKDQQMNEFYRDIFRMFANQLSVGTNLDGKEPDFRSKEKCNMGQCPAEYRIFRSDIEGYCGEQKLNLVSLTDFELNNEEVLHIERNRVLDECYPPDLYYFSMRYIYDVVPVNYTDKLVSSMTNMMISTDCFISETLNFVDIYDTSKRKVGSMLDRIKVSLRSIDPAQDSLKSIFKPVFEDVVIKSTSNYGSH